MRMRAGLRTLATVALTAFSSVSALHAAEPASTATDQPLFVMPTDNHALLDGLPQDFYQFVDRNENGKVTQVWEGGQFGFVRNPATLKSGEHIFTRFHEGLDIKPMVRDARGEPADIIHAIAAGEVVHCADKPSASNYGRYVVIRHEWGEGPFCSLYAHLARIDCKVGDKVNAGTPIALMGHTGDGIDCRRAHVHVELCLFLSSRFAAWHDDVTASLNFHGMWNGLNLVGMNLAEVLKTKTREPGASVAAMVKSSPPHFRIRVRGDAEMELLQHYPWLCPVPVPKEHPRSWKTTFTAWGLPVKIEPCDEPAPGFVLEWAEASSIPQYSLTRGLLAGSTPKASLTSSGESYLRLATGTFAVKARAAQPVEPVKPASKKKKK